MSGPILTTARLELWQPAAADLADLLELTRADATRQHLGSFVPSEMDAFQRLHRNAGSWALHGYGTFMVRLKSGSQIIGNCGIFRSHRGFGAALGLDNTPEAGWIIHPAHTRQGYAAEAMEAALNWFDTTHGPQRIACMIDPANTPSHKLAAALGFNEYARHTPEGSAELVLYERSLKL